jgi:hypothetical protein
MTEVEWLTCPDPQAMLRFPRPNPGERKLQRGMSSQERKWRLREPSERKLRLFGVACCRRMVHAMREEQNTRAVDVAERLADGLAYFGLLVMLPALMASVALSEWVGGRSEGGGCLNVIRTIATTIKHRTPCRVA